MLRTSLLHSVIDIAHQAGEHLRRFYSQPIDIQIKSDNTPVTEADVFVSQFLTEKLTALSPQLPVLSEENCQVPLNERQQWSCYWLIDPIDGTQHFINRTGHFAVMIALVENHRPVLGVMYAPILGWTYYAMQHFGAFKHTTEGTKHLQKRRLDLTQPLKIVIGSEKQIEKVRSVLSEKWQYEFQIVGSSGLKSALVAEGVADCYIRLGCTGEWDTAVGEILLAETNGAIFDRTFGPLTYNQRADFANPHFVMVADREIDWRNILKFSP